MNVLRVFVLSALFGLMASATNAQATIAENSMQKDADGFSQRIADPRYTKLPTYLIELKDGELLPAELVVPAKTRFRLVVRNIGTKPAEFESNQLRQEKVLFMGADVSVVITPLDPGSYDYFDEFTNTAIGKIVAK